MMAEISALLAAGRFASAVTAARALEKAKPFDPGLVMLPRLMGEALFAAGLWREAESWLARAATLEPWDTALGEHHARCRLPAWAAPEMTLADGRRLVRHPPQEGAAYSYTIDVVGTCNLRCPTCPVGNSPARPRGFMAPELFERILAKIRAESPDPEPRLTLYNWGEPLLHPELPRLIDLAHAAGLKVQLSTNLNIRHGLEAVIAANPDELKISLSGATPESYGRTHRRGDLALVLANMRDLRRLIDTHGATTRVWIGHHLYRSSRHQLPDVAALARELGFAHHPIEAFFMPLERLAAYLDGNGGADRHGIIPDLPLDPRTRARRLAIEQDPDSDCELRFAQTVINHDGSVALCCSVYDTANMLGIDFLEVPHAEIQRRRYAHPFCAICMQHNMHYAGRRVMDLTG
jgi:pyruvate-formate lyase-activating enzyme